MLDLKTIRENPELVEKNLARRQDPAKIELFRKAVEEDAQVRELKTRVEGLRSERNKLTTEVAKAKKEGRNAEEFMKKSSTVGEEIKQGEARLAELEESVKSHLLALPNLMHESVPFGKDDSENVEIKQWGKIEAKKFDLKPHGEALQDLGLVDFDKASEVSGAGFNYLFGPLVMLERAVEQLALEHLTAKGFIPVMPPYMLHRKPYEGVVSLGDFEDVMYKVEGEDEYLIATAEHPLAALYMDEVIAEEQLPIKLVGVSPCFRKEIGSKNVDTRGLYRMHQFHKIEQFVFCKPEDSWKWHEELLKNTEELWQLLEIPYRVVDICTGDLGSIAAKKYDIEAWLPRQGKYGEVASCSNCTDYQARRLNIRYGKYGGQKELVHTLNQTAFPASSRVLVAIAENYQNADGTIGVPRALQKYLNGKKTLEAVPLFQRQKKEKQ